MLVTKAAEEEREQAVINCGDYEGSEMLVTKTAEEEQKVQQLELYLEQANLANVSCFIQNKYIFVAVVCSHHNNV
jgi:hypothetical protein